MLFRSNFKGEVKIEKSSNVVVLSHYSNVLGSRYPTVKYSELQYSKVRYNKVQYSTVRYSEVQYSTVRYSEVQYSDVQ